MTFDKELNKKSLGELYYGKENLMGEGVTRFLSLEEIERYRKEKIEMEKNKGEERPMVNDAKVKKVKPKRFHVDLSPEMGQDLSDLAEKMGLTLNAVVKLFLMDDWQKLKVNGFDYIYLGVADKPKAPSEIPF
jgi:hypothetical protein